MRAPVRLKFDPEREEADLRAYLGAAYDRCRLEHSWEALNDEVLSVRDEHVFYRTSEAYLYDLTVFAMSGTKLPYLDVLTSRVPPGSRLLDYGCGIGSDGLLLLQAGYRVEFADFNNPSTVYLRWRLEQRALEAPIHDLDGEIPSGFDAAYAYDVIEHVPDPWAFLHEVERHAALVEVNLLEFDPKEDALHYELPIGDLLRYAAHQGLKAYEFHHGCSHLVLYRTERAGPLRLLWNLARLGAARRRYRVGRATATAGGSRR